MKAIWFPLASFFLLTAGAPVHAGAVSSKLGVVLPYTGTYYDPNQSGSGLTVDVGPGGMLFLVFETYDQAGNQVNLIAQPSYVPSSEAALESGGIIGGATTSFYQAANGQCPGCAYRAPTLTAASVTANFVWASPRHVTMTFGSYTYHFQAGNFESKDDEEFVPGTWAVSFVNDNSVYPGEGPEYQNALPTELAVMRIAPAPFTMAQMTLDPASSSDVKLPPANAHLYTLQCAGNQMGADETACNTTELIWTNVVPGSQRNAIPLGTAKAVIWYDAATAAAGMDIYQQGANGSVVVGPADFHGELYITPDTLQVHLQAQGPPGVAAVTDGTEGIALTFTRLPSSAVRDCYDYPSSTPCQ
jgi:hypothetical protein